MVARRAHCVSRPWTNQHLQMKSIDSILELLVQSYCVSPPNRNGYEKQLEDVNYKF